MSAVVGEVVRKPGGRRVLGRNVRSQADLALAVRGRLPLLALKGLAQAGLSEQEIERFVSRSGHVAIEQTKRAAEGQT